MTLSFLLPIAVLMDFYPEEGPSLPPLEITLKALHDAHIIDGLFFIDWFFITDHFIPKICSECYQTRELNLKPDIVKVKNHYFFNSTDYAVYKVTEIVALTLIFLIAFSFAHGMRDH